MVLSNYALLKTIKQRQKISLSLFNDQSVVIWDQSVHL